MLKKWVKQVKAQTYTIGGK